MRLIHRSGLAMTMTQMALLAISSGNTARASLIGTNVTINYNGFIDVVTVSSGVELTCPGPFNTCNSLTQGSINIGPMDILFTHNGVDHFGTGANSFNFLGLNPGSPITGVSLTTDIPGLTSNLITFAGNSLQINVSGLQLPGPTNNFDLILSTAASAPEPGTLWLGLALLVPLAVRNRRVLFRLP